MYCVKPLDKEGLVEAAKKAKVVISIEEHAPFGGLGSMVSQVVGAECPRKVVEHVSAGCTGDHGNFQRSL